LKRWLNGEEAWEEVGQKGEEVPLPCDEDPLMGSRHGGVGAHEAEEDPEGKDDHGEVGVAHLGTREEGSGGKNRHCQHRCETGKRGGQQWE